jgi:hypothetical protein
VAASAQVFQQQWRPGRRVQEIAAPRRKGTVRARQGTGANARITVTLDGRPPATFRPGQLTLL